MKTIKVAEATNNQLNWLVAKCEGAASIRFDGEFWRVLIQEPDVLDYEEYLGNLDYTTDPSQMWPIIDREKIDIEHTNWEPTLCYAKKLGDETGGTRCSGIASLIAAARCYVMSKLGEEVEVPEELT